MTPPSPQVERRSPARPRPVAVGPLAACLLALLGATTHHAAEPQPAAAPAVPPLDRVLDTPRRPDVDILFLREGDRQTGTLANEQFALQCPYARLDLPARVVAGIELADGRGSRDVVITRAGDRFTGFLLDPEFRLRNDSRTDEWVVRRERVERLVTRLGNAGLAPSPPQLRLVLRNGDFFVGTLRNDQFRVAVPPTELAWSRGEIHAATFPLGSDRPGRLELPDGKTVIGEPADDDLEFELSWGGTLRIYRGLVEHWELAGPLPPELRRRLGAGDDPEIGSAATAQPDPEVMPVPGMVWINPGEFLMGSPADEAGRDLDEGPQTTVVIPTGFWIGRHEVTQAEYLLLMHSNPSLREGATTHPVERVNWQEAMAYCRALTGRERQQGHLPEGYAYRLPTEAEWEYAARAGSTTRYGFGDDTEALHLAAYAWFDRNSDSTTHPVGSKAPNRWGLHDLHGNVAEWCLDAWRARYPGERMTNHAAIVAGDLRVARGGSWLYAARFCRSANRESYGTLNRCSDLGFRIVLAGIPPPAEEDRP
jgi:formylglycine-generating enzyme required for sulfatase activity